MTKEQQQVHEFMTYFEQDTPPFPTLPGSTVRLLRVSLIQEELDELKLALIKEGSLVLSADALGDLLYVVLGTAVALGIDLDPIFQEIHFSNMTKFHLDHAGRRYIKKTALGKVIKPLTYSPANIGRLIEKQLPTNVPSLIVSSHATNITSNP